MKTYEVSVSCIFDADSPEDAVAQAAAWLDDVSYQTGYRVTDVNDVDDTCFIDAEDIDWGGIWDD